MKNVLIYNVYFHLKPKIIWNSLALFYFHISEKRMSLLLLIFPLSNENNKII